MTLIRFPIACSKMDFCDCLSGNVLKVTVSRPTYPPFSDLSDLRSKTWIYFGLKIQNLDLRLKSWGEAPAVIQMLAEVRGEAPGICLLIWYILSFFSHLIVCLSRGSVSSKESTVMYILNSSTITEQSFQEFITELLNRIPRRKHTRVVVKQSESHL